MLPFRARRSAPTWRRSLWRRRPGLACQRDSPTGADARATRYRRGHPRPGAFVVRGLFFDKTPTTNWNLPWHQDMTIAVRAAGRGRLRPLDAQSGNSARPWPGGAARADGDDPSPPRRLRTPERTDAGAARLARRGQARSECHRGLVGPRRPASGRLPRPRGGCRGDATAAPARLGVRDRGRPSPRHPSRICRRNAPRRSRMVRIGDRNAIGSDQTLS